MNSSCILSVLFFILLIYSCTALLQMYTAVTLHQCRVFVSRLRHSTRVHFTEKKPTQKRDVQSRQKDKVTAMANDDPCSRAGMWLFMSEKDQKNAERGCEDVFNIFVSLAQGAQDACLNAASPDCRPLPECDNLTYGCTFICDNATLAWQTNEETGKSEQVIVPGQEEKHLKVIVEEYTETFKNRKLAAQNRKKRGEPRDESSGPKPGSSSRYKRKTVDLQL